MNRLRMDSLFWIGVRPFNWSGCFVVMTDVAQEFGAQVGHGVKDAACDDMTLDFGKPVFDLVEPGGVGRREVQAQVGMGCKKGIHQFGFMGREVIGDDVDLFASGLRSHDLLQKGDELRAGVALGCPAQNLPATGLKGGIKGKRAVAKVFKAVRLGPSRGKRQDRIKAIQSLNGALFIHTEDSRMSRGVQIEADDVGSLGFKIRVIADHVMAQTMGLKAVTLPDSGYRHMGGCQLAGKASAAPLGAAVIGAAPRPLQDAGLQLGCALCHRTPSMPGDQAAHALGAKASRPSLHIRGAARQRAGCPTQSTSACQLQNNPSASRIFSPHTARAHPALKFPAFWRTKYQSFGCHPCNLLQTVAAFKVTLH